MAGQGRAVKRFKLIAYYEDKDARSRVAQVVIVLAEDVKGAVEAIRRTVGPRALDGHIIAVKVKERDEVETGVVFTGEPYIPLHWPLNNRGQQAADADSASGAAAQPREADAEALSSLDDFLEPT